MTESEIALIVQETRYGTDCPVSGDFNAAVRDAILAGYRAGLREALDAAEAEVKTTRGLVQEARRMMLPAGTLQEAYRTAWGVQEAIRRKLEPLPNSHL